MTPMQIALTIAIIGGVGIIVAIIVAPAYYASELNCPNYIIPSEQNCQKFHGDAPVTVMYARYQFCEYDNETGWHYNQTHATNDGQTKGMCLP